MLFHGADLHGRGVGAQQQAVALRALLLIGDEERVLGVARGMVGRKVERLEVVVIAFDLGAFGDGVAHLDEDRDQFVQGAQDGMAHAQRTLDAGQRDVEGFGLEAGAREPSRRRASSAAETSASACGLSALTRWPTSRLAGPGAAFSQGSLTWVSRPFLRAIQRLRNSSNALGSAQPQTRRPRTRRPAPRGIQRRRRRARRERNLRVWERYT